MNNKKLKRGLKVVLFIFVLIICYSIYTSFQIGRKQVNTYELKVVSNDTIWSIAKEICKKDSSLNIQNVIIEIKDINNLNCSEIYAGQTLNIPIY